MKRIIICTATLLLAVGAAGCSKSQDDIAGDCAKALTHMKPAAIKAHRPGECKGLTDDNYELVVMNNALTNQGIVSTDPAKNSQDDIERRLLEQSGQ